MEQFIFIFIRSDRLLKIFAFIINNPTMMQRRS